MEREHLKYSKNKGWKLNWIILAFIVWIILMAVSIPLGLQSGELIEMERQYPGYIAGNAIGYLLIILGISWILHKIYQKLKPSDKNDSS